MGVFTSCILLSVCDFHHLHVQRALVTIATCRLHIQTLSGHLSNCADIITLH